MKLLLCIAILFLTLTANAQERPNSPDEVKPEQPKCVHTDDDFYESLRHSGPIQISHADGRSITAVIYKKNLIEHKTFQMARTARTPKDFYVMNLKRRWFLLYCIVHSTVYVAEPIK
jgi:hypothetical protein